MSEKKRLLDWVNAKSKTWGYAKRRLLTAKESYPQSFAGKIFVEGPGAALANLQGGSKDVECFTGDALEIAVAIHRLLQARKLTDRQYEVFYGHYVVPGAVKQKQHALGICPSRYYEILGIVHHDIAECLDPDKVGGF